MALPDFFVIGAPKAGSTALHAALLAHPALFLSDPKEPKYYLTDGRRPRRTEQRGPGDAHSALEWVWRRDRYEKLFADAPAGRLLGESTPFYLHDGAAHERIARDRPNAKLIAVIRDPVDRAYSNWTHLRADGLEPEADFLRACDLEASRIARGWAPFWRYLELGRYGEQLAHLYQYFPREQVAVVRYRELIDAPAETLDWLCEFLGIETGVLTGIPGSNVSSWAPDSAVDTGLRAAMRTGAAIGSFAPPKVWRQVSKPLLAALHRGDPPRPKLDVAVRRELVGRFAEDVALLEELQDRDFQDWLGDSGRGAYAVRKSLAPSERDASQK